MSPEAFTRRIQDRLRTHNPRGVWLKDAHYHLLLNFPHSGSAAWTPQMDINLEELGGGRTLVRCLIGPTPGIWMLFAAGYVGAALAALTGITLGIAQLMLGRSAWGFWALPVALLLAAFMVYLERTGRSRARQDMRLLKELVDEALGCDCLKLAEARIR